MLFLGLIQEVDADHSPIVSVQSVDMVDEGYFSQLFVPCKLNRGWNAFLLPKERSAPSDHSMGDHFVPYSNNLLWLYKIGTRPLIIYPSVIEPGSTHIFGSSGDKVVIHHSCFEGAMELPKVSLNDGCFPLVADCFKKTQEVRGPVEARITLCHVVHLLVTQSDIAGEAEKEPVRKELNKQGTTFLISCFML